MYTYNLYNAILYAPTVVEHGDPEGNLLFTTVFMLRFYLVVLYA